MQILFTSREKARSFAAKGAGRKVKDNGVNANKRWGVVINRK